jgi:hypothetical protein
VMTRRSIDRDGPIIVFVRELRNDVVALAFTDAAARGRTAVLSIFRVAVGTRTTVLKAARRHSAAAAVPAFDRPLA